MEDRGIVTESGIYRGRVRGAWTRGNAEGRKVRKEGFDEDGSGVEGRGCGCGWAGRMCGDGTVMREEDRTG